MSENMSTADRRLYVGDRRGWAASRRGALLIFFALSMFALTALLAIAIDGGNMQRQRRMAQKAADAASLAGAIEIFRNRADLAVSAATAEATRNGFTTGGGVTVDVHNPPISGRFRTNKYVQVIIQTSQSSIFAKAIGWNLLTVKSGAVAGALTSASACITTLDPLMKDAMWINSSAQIHATNCNVVVNSSNSEAMYVAGGTAITTSSPGTIGVYGTCDCIGTVSPSVIHVDPVPDPLASVALLASETDHCDFGTDGDLTVISATQSLPAGVYCGGLKITGAGTTVTMQAGLFVMKGGGFKVQSAMITGTGVSIANINGPPPNGASDYDVIDVTSNLWNVTAMTSGSLAGILFYSPRGSGPATKAPQKNRIHSDAVLSTFGGSIYLPDQELSLESNANMNIYGGIVVGDLRAAGVNVTVDPSLGPVPPGALARATVVE